MKKKGFTLVELLAVIAILAILVIIALPNVMGMFNTAKENSFATEIKTIVQQAEQQWITDSMMSTGERYYARLSTTSCGTGGKTIDLSGRQELNYVIRINQAGKIVEYYAEDGTYSFKYTGDSTTPLEITGITADKIKSIAENSTNAITWTAVTSATGKVKQVVCGGTNNKTATVTLN